ncbi:MAG: hypothetical protein JKY90_03035 [Gammaproteobacteria bacterium]|nr:hypothetical protein [Gammaproteobacteria bacterium]
MMTIFEVSMCMAVVTVLYLIVSPLILAHRRYQRDQELLGRPVIVRMTHCS